MKKIIIGMLLTASQLVMAAGMSGNGTTPMSGHPNGTGAASMSSHPNSTSTMSGHPNGTATMGDGVGAAASPTINPFGAYDDSCKLYLCLMGMTESDGDPIGGNDCSQRISSYKSAMKSCTVLPLCNIPGGSGSGFGNGMVGIVDSPLSGSYNVIPGTGGPENGQIVQSCDTVYDWFGDPLECTITLTSPATGSTPIIEFALFEGCQ